MPTFTWDDDPQVTVILSGSFRGLAKPPVSYQLIMSYHMVYPQGKSLDFTLGWDVHRQLRLLYNTPCRSSFVHSCPGDSNSQALHGARVRL